VAIAGAAAYARKARSHHVLERIGPVGRVLPVYVITLWVPLPPFRSAMRHDIGLQSNLE
jgi:hypothetical protein